MTQRKPEPETPRRTPTQILGDVALAQAQRGTALSSTRVWTNANGEPQWEIDVKHEDPRESYKIANELATRAARDYPRSPKPPAPAKTVVVHSRKKT